MGRFYLIVVLVVLMVMLSALEIDASHQRRQTQRTHRKAARYCKSIGDKSPSCASKKKAYDYNQRKRVQPKPSLERNNSQQPVFPDFFVKIYDFFNNATSYFQ